MKAIAYCRVSTDKQQNSAESQEKRVRAQAMLKNFDLIDVVVDTDEFSGNLQRPGMQRVLEMVHSGKVGAVIITKLDRLTRSTRDAIDLAELFRKKNVALISIDDSIDTNSPMGEFFYTVMAAIGQLERKVIGSRTSEGLQHLKAQGYPAGPAPYGWKAQPRTAEEKKLKVRKPLLRDAAEQRIIARIQELRREGVCYDAIAEILNDEGHRTRGGGRFVFQSVQRIWLNADRAERKAAA